MEQRQLMGCGLRVPVLSFGTATFGGEGAFFGAWGNSDVDQARRLVDICLEAGASFFDTANGSSAGRAESILGAAIAGRRDELLLSTKATIPLGTGPNDYGSSRYHLIGACEASLKRLGTDHIDLYFMHGFDNHTPVEETLRALDDLVSSGKVRYVGCSNFSGWQLMKSLAVSERHGWTRYVANQAYYSLLDREFEWELMPLGADQKVSTQVWSALAGGALSGKLRRDRPPAANTRVGQIGTLGPLNRERLFRIVDVLDEISREIGKTISQVALNWVLGRPTVANVVVGARTEAQLRENLAAVGWKLDPAHVARLDAASEVPPIYPYWHQRGFPMLQKPPI